MYSFYCIVYSTLRSAQQKSTTGPITTTTGPITNNTGPVTTTTGPINASMRRTQQTQRRSARNKDKVVIAAEKCLYSMKLSLELFPEDVRSYVLLILEN